MPAAAPTYTMAPSTFSTSWNLQVESRARWDDDAPLVAAAMDEEKELGLTCDREGVLKLWRWPLSDGRDAQGATRSDPVVELSRAYTPNGKLPLQLVSVPRQGAFLAVFATLVSAADDAEPPGDDDSDDGIVDLSQFAGGEIHAYARDAAGELVHAPLLRTSHGVLRWILDTDGLSPRERYAMARPPALALVLPPKRPGDPNWRVCCATGTSGRASTAGARWTSATPRAAASCARWRRRTSSRRPGASTCGGT